MSCVATTTVVPFSSRVLRMSLMTRLMWSTSTWATGSFKEKDLSLQDQCAGQGNPLGLAPRKLRAQTILKSLKIGKGQCPRHPGRHLRLRNPLLPEAIGYVEKDRALEEVRGLVGEGHPSPQLEGVSPQFTGRPSMESVPADGLSRRLRMRRMVVFPAPLCPRKTVTSPPGDLQGLQIQNLLTTKILLQPTRREHHHLATRPDCGQKKIWGTNDLIKPLSGPELALKPS